MKAERRPVRREEDEDEEENEEEENEEKDGGWRMEGISGRGGGRE